ncbi:MAG TPA: rhomboid family intramembrane serine protease [Polyangium sp.]|nr:rhomboid family intramembrane serine protease [Polyangium sp.]
MLPIRDRLPTRRPPIVNWVIIILNIGAFIWMQALISVAGPGGADMRAHELVTQWGLVPRFIMHHPVDALPSVLTSMFTHDPSGFAHIGGNMLYLWIFGDNVEDALGHARYAMFYVLCGVFAALAQILIDPNSVVPMVGASGAISGVLAAYGSRYPRSPITVLNPILPLWLFFGIFLELPAWFLILEYFVMNLLSGLSSLGGRGGGVAFFAHLGGFVAGLVLVRLFVESTRRDYEPWSQFRSRPRTPAPPPDGASRRGRGDPWGW